MALTGRIGRSLTVDPDGAEEAVGNSDRNQPLVGKDCSAGLRFRTQKTGVPHATKGAQRVDLGLPSKQLCAPSEKAGARSPATLWAALFAAYHGAFCFACGVESLGRQPLNLVRRAWRLAPRSSALGVRRKTP